MRRVVTKHNQVTPAPAGAFIEVVRDAGSSKESKTEYLSLSEVGAAPTGFAAPLTPISSPTQALTGTGALAAIDLDAALTTVDTTGAATSTMAAGTTIGQTKTLRMIGDIGDFVITVTGTGVNSVTLNDVGDVCTLMWLGLGWSINDNLGCVIA